MILSLDIGGTKTIAGLFARTENGIELVQSQKFSSKGINLEVVIRNFLRSCSVSSLDAACFSFAGPIQENFCRLVNLGQDIDLLRLRETFSEIPIIKFCNDLTAMGKGISILKKEDLYCLHPGNPPRQDHTDSSLTKALLAPGTGLGESFVIQGEVQPTEGGHSDFAPQSELEIELWRFLARQYGHVSYERLLSGPGLQNIYRFFKMQTETTDENRDLEPAEISEKALARNCPLCERSLELFTKILGAEAGNLALKTLAEGGVYLGGGLPPKILPFLKHQRFLNSYWNKGRFSSLVKRIPVYVILNELTPLMGAALIAAEKPNS